VMTKGRPLIVTSRLRGFVSGVVISNPFSLLVCLNGANYVPEMAEHLCPLVNSGGFSVLHNGRSLLTASLRSSIYSRR
jgi:hypothetical protein